MDDGVKQVFWLFISISIFAIVCTSFLSSTVASAQTIANTNNVTNHIVWQVLTSPGKCFIVSELCSVSRCLIKTILTMRINISPRHGKWPQDSRAEYTAGIRSPQGGSVQERTEGQRGTARREWFSKSNNPYFPERYNKTTPFLVGVVFRGNRGGVVEALGGVIFVTVESIQMVYTPHRYPLYT